MTDRPEYDHPEGVDPDIWEQELAGEGAMHAVFVLARRRLRELEQSEGFNQSQLAARMGLTRTQISRWFSSPSNMTLRNAAKVLMAMGRRLEFSISDPYAVTMSTPSGQLLAPFNKSVVIDFAAARAARDAARNNQSERVLAAGNWQLAAKAGDRPESGGAKPKAQAKRLRWLGEIEADSGIVECYNLDKMVIVRSDAFSDPELLRLDDRSYPLEAIPGHADAFYVIDLKPPACDKFITAMATSPADHSCSWE